MERNPKPAPRSMMQALAEGAEAYSGLLLRNLIWVAIISKPCYLLYIPILVTQYLEVQG